MPELTFKVKGDVSDLKRSFAEARREVSRGLGSISLPGLGTAGGLAGGGLLAGVSLLVRKAVDDYLELANAVQQFGVTAQASAQQASTLIGVSRQLGIETSTLDAAFNALKTAVAGHPEQFAALGIALKDADGNARPLIDVFNQLRERLAGATKDAGTLQVAQELLGPQYKELLPLLGLTSDQLQVMQDRVAELGGVVDKEGIEKAREYQGQLKELELTAQGAGNTFAKDVVPVFTGALQMIGQGFDTLGIFATSVLEMLILQGARAAHALDALFHGDFASAKTLGEAFAGGFKDPAELLGQAIAVGQQHADAAAARTRATAAAIVNAGSAGGGPSLGFATQRATGGGGKGRDTVADALHDRIDAIKETAKAQEQATRDTLQAYEREKQGVIDATTAEKDVVRQGFDVRIQQIQDLADAEDEGHRMRERVRDDEINALREQVRGTQELVDLERSRADVADAEASAASERNVEIFRSAGQSQNEYGRAVRDQQKKIADADKRVAETKKKLDEDTAKAGIDARIRAIEAEREADTRLMEDKRAERDELLKSTRHQMDVEQEAYQARIDGMQAELKAEQQRVGDIIEAESRKTDAIVLDLENELKEHTRVAAAVGAAWDFATRPRNIVITTSGVAAGAADATPRMGGIREFAEGGAGILSEPTLLRASGRRSS